MTCRIIAALALTLGLGTAAFAQSSTTGADTSAAGAATGSVTLPKAWEGDIASAFFTDPAAGTLKSDEEIKSAWANLSSDQQAQVKTDCQSHMASAGTGSDSMKTGSTSTTTTGGAATSSGTTAGATDPMTASLDKLCGDISGM